MTESSEKNPPYDTAEYGPFEIGIWRKANDQGRYIYSTGRPSKSYFDKKAQQWKRTSTFIGRDNLAVSKLYDRADDRIAEHEEADYQSRKDAVDKETTISIDDAA
ncbi:MAG: hypothetical protein AAGD11_07630 [Planctomycetota bacterium]